MNVLLKKLYKIAFFVFLVMLIMAFFQFNNVTLRPQTTTGHEEITEYEYYEEFDLNAVKRLARYYKLPAPPVSDAYRSLVFYTKHHNVCVYIEDEMIYENAAGNYAFSESIGAIWNVVTIPDCYAGKDIVIRMEPVYNSVKNDKHEFFFGDASEILLGVVRNNMLVFAVAMGIGIMGLVMLGYSVMTFGRLDSESGIGMLGLFAVMFSVWTVSDTAAIKILIPDNPGVSMLSFVALLLMIIPFAQYFKKHFQLMKDHWMWTVCSAVSMTVIIFTMFCQILGVFDFRELLYLSQATLVFCILLCAVMVIIECIRNRITENSIKSIISLAICLCATSVEFVGYYLGDPVWMKSVGLFGFLLLIFLTGIDSLRDTFELVNKGKQARRMEAIAMCDQLTGLKNRHAYNEKINSDSFQLEGCFIVVCDLNNLKKVNDNYGHDVGDTYIKASASIITECFGDLGECYRMGGDEFTVIIEGNRSAEAKARVEKLREMETDYRLAHPQTDMHIACGYALYNNKIDLDIMETARRADTMMYENKFAIKTEYERK